MFLRPPKLLYKMEVDRSVAFNGLPEIEVAEEGFKVPTGSVKDILFTRIGL